MGVHRLFFQGRATFSSGDQKHIIGLPKKHQKDTIFLEIVYKLVSPADAKNCTYYLNGPFMLFK